MTPQVITTVSDLRQAVGELGCFFSLPDGLIDVMTVVVLLGVLFFFVRRLVVPRVRAVSGLQDYLVVAIAGRVYCKAEASSAPIKPGDLLSVGPVTFRAVYRAGESQPKNAQWNATGPTLNQPLPDPLDDTGPPEGEL